ncbi:TatD family hydrolase [Patescibacteria group bacterium]|nr:TatD family hydrolase [Patescibacteria group bacterium]
MIDTHAHLNFENFSSDYSEVIKRSLENNVRLIINVGTNLVTSQKAVDLAEENESCRATVGCHPLEIEEGNFDLEQYRNLIIENQNKVKAVGEIGLDYYYSQKEKVQQKEILIRQISLAQEFKLPLILHCRGDKEKPFEAYQELLEILKKDSFSGIKGVAHCFGANWSLAKKFLDLGFLISFTGIVTFKNAGDQLLEVVKKVPLDKFLLETDSPYLAPAPYRGQRNEPSYIPLIAQRIADLKEVSLEEVSKVTTLSAQKLFNLS